MYNALKSIKSKKFIIFLMVVQFAYGITILNEIYGLVNIAKDKKAKFEKVVPSDNSYILEVNGGPDIYNHYGELENMYSKILKETENSRYINNIYIAYPSIVYTEDYWDEEIGIKYDSINPFARQVSNIIIDRNFYEKYDFKVVKGRTLKESDFDKDYRKENIPILLGNEYIEKIDIGHVFERNNVAWVDRKNLKDIEKALKREKVKFEVVGILEKNPIPIPTEFTSNISSTVGYSNAISVIPSVKDYMSYNAGEGLGETGIYLEAKVGATDSNIQKEIEKIINEYLKENKISASLSVELIKIDKAGIDLGLDKNINNAKMLGGVMVLLSLLGITITMVGDVKKRRKEFGIKISQGASLKDLCLEIMFEIGILISIAIIISWAFIISRYGIEAITVKTALNSILVIVISSVMTSLLPIYEMKNLEVKDLLRGK
ncbi:MAG: ABC transporter permease [Clostridium chrysemydis]|uniref:ABC transporter permease n=1 Tax=Clostridium chrysemydis TaxID=2665504 RepID=UPI003F2F1D17